MGRIVGMDIGQKRIGLAVTDPLGIFATGLDTVAVSDIFRYLSDYTEKEKIDTFVVGSPMKMNNLPSESTRYIEPFVRKLATKFPGIPVRRIDERFTSKLARQAILDSGIRKMARRNKAMVDKISAVIMLQSFLDQEKNFYR
jgi:putative holliday junction resolvase